MIFLPCFRRCAWYDNAPAAHRHTHTHTHTTKQMCNLHRFTILLSIKKWVLAWVLKNVFVWLIKAWPLTATLTKKLNAARHRWQRSILGISWKDRVTNEEVRVRTGQHSVDDIGYLVKEDSVGLDMWYGWITSAYLDRCCTGRFRGSSCLLYTSDAADE